MCIRLTAAVLVFWMVACRTPAHRVETPYATVYAEEAEVAASFSERVERLRLGVLSQLPHASEEARYCVVVLDPDDYDQVRLTAHAGGQIFKNPFSDSSRITIPSDCPDAVIAHELVHAHRTSFWRPLTRFMEEGLADHIADELDPSVTYLADAVVYLGFYFRVPHAEAHTLVYRYPSGVSRTMNRTSQGVHPFEVATFDPLLALAAPRTFFNSPRLEPRLPLSYSAARVVMHCAIGQSEGPPLAGLAALCEEARATRAGVLDASEVFALAGFTDSESFRAYIEESFEQAWLDSHFSTPRIVELILEIEAHHDRVFATPRELFEHADLRYLLGDHIRVDPGAAAEEYPGFREHIIGNWPTPEHLHDARLESKEDPS